VDDFRLTNRLLITSNSATVATKRMKSSFSSVANFLNSGVIIYYNRTPHHVHFASRLELPLLCPKSQIAVTCFDVVEMMVSKLILLEMQWQLNQKRV
jgi:hypothetical protein